MIHVLGIVSARFRNGSRELRKKAPCRGLTEVIEPCVVVSIDMDRTTTQRAYALTAKPNALIH